MMSAPSASAKGVSVDSSSAPPDAVLRNAARDPLVPFRLVIQAGPGLGLSRRLDPLTPPRGDIPAEHVHATRLGVGTASTLDPRSRSARSLGCAAADDDPLDPFHRHRASLAAPEGLGAGPLVSGGPMGPGSSLPPSLPSAARTPSSLEDLLPALVRRVSWSGDALRGTARLEIGAGELSGATLLVHADAGRVRIHLDVPAGVDANSWKQRIASRLASRNIPTDSVEVT